MCAFGAICSPYAASAYVVARPGCSGNFTPSTSVNKLVTVSNGQEIQYACGTSHQVLVAFYNQGELPRSANNTIDERYLRYLDVYEYASYCKCNDGYYSYVANVADLGISGKCTCKKCPDKSTVPGRYLESCGPDDFYCGGGLYRIHHVSNRKYYSSGWAPSSTSDTPIGTYTGDVCLPVDDTEENEAVTGFLLPDDLRLCGASRRCAYYTGQALVCKENYYNDGAGANSKCIICPHCTTRNIGSEGEFNISAFTSQLNKCIFKGSRQCKDAKGIYKTSATCD